MSDPAILPDATAFALATASPDGHPSVRMLLLKGVDARGFIFYTNLGSRKARELAANPFASICFHWAPLELQVRVEGAVSAVTPEEADAYFQSRPRESQVGAWASCQSEQIPEDGDLERRYAEVEARYAGQVVPRPQHWSGYVLGPALIEFWEGRPFRLHRRELYTRTAAGWKTKLLFP